MNTMVQRTRLPWLARRLVSIFLETPSWAELSSALAILSYVTSMILSGKEPEEFETLAMLTRLLPDWWWPGVTVIFAVAQLAGVLLENRFLRMASDFCIILWLCFLTAMVSSVFGWSPTMSLGAAWVLPNVFAVARHARDW